MDNNRLIPITVTAWVELKSVMKSDRLKRQAAHTLVYVWKQTDLAVQSRMASSKAGRMMWDMKRQGVADMEQPLGKRKILVFYGTAEHLWLVTALHS